MHNLQETLVITGTSGICKKKEDLLPLHKRRGSYVTFAALIAQKTA